MALLLPRRFQGFLNAGMGAAVSLWGVRGRATADRSGEAIIHVVLLKQMFSVLLFKKNCKYICSKTIAQEFNIEKGELQTELFFPHSSAHCCRHNVEKRSVRPPELHLWLPQA